MSGYAKERTEDITGERDLVRFIESHYPGDVLRFRRVGKRGFIYLRVIDSMEYQAAK